MPITQEAAVALAFRHAEARGYCVVGTFEGVPWLSAPRNVKFTGARWCEGELTGRWASGEWSVMFDTQLAPGVESQEPSDMCVLVNGSTGECYIYPLL